MRILLVRPSSLSSYVRVLQRVTVLESLALEYVGAGVSKDHDVKLYDMRVENGMEGLQEMLESFKPEIVACTCMTCEITAVKRICTAAKDFDNRILTVIGGVHPTYLTEAALVDSVDLAVVGEGVFTFKEIVQHHERGQTDFSDIKGVALRRDGKIHITPPRPACDIDELPFPDRSLTAHCRHKYTFALWHRHVAAMRTQAGCPFNCEFCICWKITGQRLLKRNIDSVIEELWTIQEPYIMMIDDEFFADSKRTMELGKRILAEGIKKNYMLFARADTICKHQDMFELWKQAGASEIFVGLEAPTNDELDGMNKRTDQAQNDQALQILERLELNCIGAMIVNPNYGKEEFQKMLEYARKCKLESPVFQVMTPFPGTDFYARVKDQMVDPDNFNLYDFAHTLLPTKLDLKEFYAEYNKLMQYNYEPVPAGYHMRKMAMLPEEQREEALRNISGIIENYGGMWKDHLDYQRVL